MFLLEIEQNLVYIILYTVSKCVVKRKITRCGRVINGASMTLIIYLKYIIMLYIKQISHQKISVP